MKKLVPVFILMFFVHASHAQSTFIVSNINNTGVGSLRQAISDANATPTVLPHTIVFNVPAGLLTSGVARIQVSTTPLPLITVPVIIDGATQTAFTGNLNSGTWGTGGSVGCGTIALAAVNRPEVEVYNDNTVAYGFEIASGNVTVSNICMFGFGTGQNNRNAEILLRSGNNISVTGNVFGFPAAGPMSDPGAGIRTNGSHIIIATSSTPNQSNSVSNVTISNNIIAFATYRGIMTPYATGVIGLNPGDDVLSTINGLTINGNELRNNGLAGGTTAGNIEILTAYGRIGSVTSNLLIEGNLITGSAADAGIEIAFGPNDQNIDIRHNTIRTNEIGIAITNDFNINMPDGGGNSGNNTSRDTIANNDISQNGRGVELSGSRTNATLVNKTITQNCIYNNSSVGIDLINTTNFDSFGLTPNDGVTNSNFSNHAYDYPVLVSSCLGSTTLQLQGYTPVNARIELFVAEPDLYYGTPTCHGEGRYYIGTLIENGTAPALNNDGTPNELAGIVDEFTGTGNYSGSLNGCNEGAASNQARTQFTIPISAIPGGYVATNYFTATATDADGNTSEFGLNIRFDACTELLPVQLIHFSGILNEQKHAVLNWKLANTEQLLSLSVEKNIDGRNFYKLYELSASKAAAYLQYTDIEVNSGVSYYRLKIESADGKKTYSDVVKLISDKINRTVIVSPNPFHDKIVLQINSGQHETVSIRLMSIDGKQIALKHVNVNKGSNIVEINQLSGVPNGIYTLQVNINNNVKVIKLVK